MKLIREVLLQQKVVESPGRHLEPHGACEPLFPVAVLFGNLGDVIGEMDRAFVIPVGKNTRETALHYTENNKKNQRKLDNKFAGNSIQFRSG